MNLDSFVCCVLEHMLAKSCFLRLPAVGCDMLHKNGGVVVGFA